MLMLLGKLRKREQERKHSFPDTDPDDPAFKRRSSIRRSSTTHLLQPDGSFPKGHLHHYPPHPHQLRRTPSIRARSFDPSAEMDKHSASRRSTTIEHQLSNQSPHRRASLRRRSSEAAILVPHYHHHHSHADIKQDWPIFASPQHPILKSHTKSVSETRHQQESRSSSATPNRKNDCSYNCSLC